MFARIFTLLSALAIAAPVVSAVPTFGNGNSCSTGTIQCCQSIQSAHSHEVAELIGSVGGSLNGITGTVGINCVHIGAVTNSCTAQTACCTGGRTIGLVAVGCSPISL
ncbi:hydrophobin-251 [Amanita rubescens]|nr:hydrophobin-251 [Amanita rubescens]